MEQTPIVFSSDRDVAGSAELYAMSPDGTSVRRITREGGFYAPSWSPDGTSIAFRQIVEGTRADVGVITPDDESPPVLLTRGENARASRWPLDWSRDGKRIDYASWRAREDQFVWTVSKTGGEPLRALPDVACCQQAVARAADGKQLVYVTHNGDFTLDLWLISDHGAPALNLTSGRVFAPMGPRWSPDGTRIAFSGYVVDAEGDVEGLAAHLAGGAAPDSELFVLSVPDAELTRLTDNDANDEAPTWSPDGKQLLIQSDRDGDLDLWLLPLAAPEQARNLIDDSEEPRDEESPHWYRR